MKVAIYLRKSRADEEAEHRGEFETLSRHKTTLLKIAKEQSLNVIEIKEELISGESITYRPKMLELLNEVEENKYDAVLVMDIDRLGRGNMQDQGLILDTFKKSKTKIITPRKTYDLNDEFDEEYSEFEAFMARKELKLISRRMQRGKIKSIEEGKFIAQAPPYGYDIKYLNNKERILVINEDKATVVKIIFDMYLKGTGAYKIAEYLNELGYRTTTGRTWYEKGVRDIIKNKVYCGYIVWNRVERKRNSSRTRGINEQIESKGKHKPIISEETWNKAQSIRKKRSNSPTPNNKITNPLAGIVKCGYCNYTLVGKFNTTSNGYEKYMVCTNCKNKSTKLNILENKILEVLNKWLIDYKLSLKEEKINFKLETEDNLEHILMNLNRELTNLEKQKERLHDFLEQGIYDSDTFIERSKVLSSRIENIKKSINKTNIDIEIEKERNLAKTQIIPRIEKVLMEYTEEKEPCIKNVLLKTVIDYAIYKKEPHQRGDDFSLIIYPNIPNN
ncbi:recombinase family protein [Clostridioides difficile]|uniref:recombinase family protein n=1 Tax=Clostridioides difficile TaxID=1496 RepID=UPI00038CD511|nr:recombinase family protein [Clostridioides difficile]EGT4639429.1 recombinase family protein [Clostridioides difficile]EQJ83988.1 resolvase, N terminal domain protein [Clostridioides difficile P48]MBH8104184.1 recombinase family protein [Clostridioides difficile]MBJ9796279.1 recombinase family protein [Clostridioides difficile]MCA0606693.1 recombinase family protein [Clostridioides difficile]